MMQSEEYMQRCLDLAQQGGFCARPNPLVGAVIVKTGEIVAEGYHAVYGQGHGERNAIDQAGDRAQGATLYVSLEPCCFEGKTGACTSAIVEAGISKVVFGMFDPNPKVSGEGVEVLRQAGIIVEGPCLPEQAEKLNRGFCKRMRQHLPWVRAKLAMSLDGRTAMESGESRWITGEEARKDVQRLRASSDAVLTGSGTVLYDDPSLNVRMELDDFRQPLRVIVDSGLRVSPQAKIFQTDGKCLIVTALEEKELEVRKAEFVAQSIEVISLADKSGRVDLLAVLRFLAREKECGDVLLESGAKLAGAMLQANLIDEVITYVAPSVLGSKAKPLFDLALDAMADKVTLQFEDVAMLGKDCRMRSLVCKSQ